jgi:hypothetical protein
MTENTKYLDELLLSYKQTIHELKQSNRDLKDIIDKLLHKNDAHHNLHHNDVNKCYDELEDIVEMNTIEKKNKCDADDDTESEEENGNVFVNHDNSQTLQDIFKIVDEYNESRRVKGFPCYEYFKSRGITRYMISKEKGLKTLRTKYFESRTFT